MEIRAFRRILVGIDLSKASLPLAEFMIGVAWRHDVELVFAYVVDELIVEHASAGYDPNKLIEALVSEARKTLEDLVARASERGVKARYVIYDTPSDPAVALALLAEREQATEIAIAHKGHRLFRIIPIGGTALSLISHSDIPVLVAKASAVEDKVRVMLRSGTGAEDLLRRIMITVDSNTSSSMLEYLAALISRAGESLEEVYVIHVIEPGEDEVQAKKIVDSTVKFLQGTFPGVRSIILEGARPYKEILAAARQLEITLLVAGRTVKREKGLLEAILGSTLNRLILHSDIPVLVYPISK